MKHKLLQSTLSALLVLFIISAAAADEYNRGVTLYIQKNYAAAREALLHTIEADPLHGDALYFLGQIEKKEGNYELALGYLQRSLNGRLSLQYRKLASWDVIILSKQRQDYKTMIRQAREYWERTGDQSARTQADQIVNQMIWTDNQKAADEYTRGTGLRDAGKTIEARAAMQNALREDPGFLAARFELGLGDYRENRTREAIANFRAVADRVPFHGAAHLLLGNIEFEQQRYREAIPWFNNALDYGFFDAETRYITLVRRGTCHYNTGNDELAQSDIERASALKPAATEPLYLLSAIHIRNNRFTEAQTILTRILQVNPQDHEALYQSGSIYYKQNDERWIATFERLHRALTGGKSSVSEQTPIKYIRALLITAREQASKGRHTEAVAILKTIPASQLDQPSRLLLGKELFETRDYAGCVAALENQQLLNDDRFLLCQAYARSGKTAEARDLLKVLLTYATRYRDSAMADSTLKSLVEEIERDKKQEQVTPGSQNRSQNTTSDSRQPSSAR